MTSAAIASLLERVHARDPRAISRAISLVEDNHPQADLIMSSLAKEPIEKMMVIGITGPPGAGKSTLTGQLISRFRAEGQRLGIIAIDPSSPISGGAILGDRVRMMQHALDPDVLVRSMATRGRLGGLCAAAGATVRIMANGGCSVIIIETVGVGQSEMDIIRLADLTLLVLAPGLGDDIQAMKAGLLEVADLLVVNKADCPGSESLALDLESVAPDRSRVCQTDALTGRGVVELSSRLASLDAEHRADGTRTDRRVQAQEREIVDLAIELLRPRLDLAVSALHSEPSTNPRHLAHELLLRLGIPDA
ncbi:MAG: methylmalonyl Co-A mutase-associated GTPase MeaB [Desulfobulbaceae bacterium]|nr:methylmalonyl Co-A mutase-associated GTPase MeaB [Desulfobulbaceae bacterium]